MMDLNDDKSLKQIVSDLGMTATEKKGANKFLKALKEQDELNSYLEQPIRVPIKGMGLNESDVDTIHSVLQERLMCYAICGYTMDGNVFSERYEPNVMASDVLGKRMLEDFQEKSIEDQAFKQMELMEKFEGIFGKDMPDFDDE